MAKYKDILEDIENVTNQEVIKQNKISLTAIGLFITSMLLLLWGLSAQDPNSSLPTFLFTAAVFLFFGSIIKFGIGRSCYLFRPTKSQLKKKTIYFDNKECQPLQHCMELKKFDDLKHMKRQINTGVKLDAMFAGDGKFAAVQLSEFVPYSYEAISPVFCYYGDEAKELALFLGTTR